jgi:membrane protease subunit HflK
MRRVGLLALILVAVYMLSGVAVIQPDEVGVVRRFGAVLAEPWPPGLHVGLPWPLDRLDRVKTGQTRTLTVGAAGPTAAPLSKAPDPAADDVLTGDLNLVTAQAILQYRVTDPAAFLFTTASNDHALTIATESALARALAGRSIDDVLTTGRAAVADRISRSVQEQADRLRLGVSVRAVRLGKVAPPVAVAPSFADAARARSDARQAVTAAEEYRDRALADASGRAREIADRAAAKHDRAVEVAHGEADRFASVLAEARKDLAATRRRLYLETIAGLVPRFGRTIVIATGQAIDLSLFGEEAERVAEPAPDSAGSGP